MLVVLVVLAIVMAFVLRNYGGKPGAKSGEYRGPVSAARDTVCRNNLSQLRASLQALSASDPDGKPPSDLQELGMPAEVRVCPTGGEPYRYDPAMGRVQCVHRGHEGY